ncbi:MAG TPA: GNAT family N-acetyltransferase [Dehalococcoidia bacterium]|jgi:CelD/BcsL family acetyltransferase involved in cellulose biosynthesis
MKVEYVQESFDSVYSAWKELQDHSSTAPIFASPDWSKVWWQQFGSESKLIIGTVKQGSKIIGIAPLKLNGSTASFMGSGDVCDYLDFVIAPGGEDTFFSELLNKLKSEKIDKLELAPLRPDSTVQINLINLAPKNKWQVSCSQDDVTVELDLPATWDEYLKLLSGKQRHELNRKLRRLNEEGDLNYRTSTDANPPDIATFLRLFRESRQDKANFLTEQMESFFRSIARAMADQNLLRLNILELDKKAVAATMCFDYRDTVYLYNSGYEPDYGWLSVGVISKALCIKDSIERGKKRFDFLKGDEAYKYQLGGQELPLFKCSLSYKALDTL